MKKLTIAGALVTLLAPLAASAQRPAQFVGPEEAPHPIEEGEAHPAFDAFETAPSKSAELTVGVGYTQAFGLLQPGVAMPDLIGPGLAVGVGGAYRFNPWFALGVEGEYQDFARGTTLESNASARGLAADVFGTVHLRPFHRLDPWLRWGTGYRMLWTVHRSAPNVFDHGFQLARLAIGLDARPSADVGIAPLVGVDLNLFLWERPDGGSNAAITDPRLSTFIYAGIQGRFDFGGAREQGSAVASRR